MSKKFASTDDLQEKKISFIQMASGCYAYTAEGDPNSGVIIGEDAVMVIEAQATPRMAKDVIAKIRTVTDKPIKYLLLTHYHAVRVLGASAYKAEKIISSTKTLDMIKERGMQDWASEFQRFPRLFKGHESITGLTWPTTVFDQKMTIDLGNKIVELLHVGEGHTRGDIIVWVPEDKVLYAGDLVEYGATPYCGDAQLEKWPHTLDRVRELGATSLVPGRGAAVLNPEDINTAISGTRAFVSELFALAKSSRENGDSLKQCYDHIMQVMQPKYGHWVIFEHCMCFNVKRAYDEAGGIEHPEIWTDEIDTQMWNQLNG